MDTIFNILFVAFGKRNSDNIFCTNKHTCIYVWQCNLTVNIERSRAMYERILSTEKEKKERSRELI